MRRDFHDCVFAGLNILVVLSVILILVFVLPQEFWNGAGLALITFIAMVLLCYLVGWIAYWFMDKIEEDPNTALPESCDMKTCDCHRSWE